MKTFLFCSLFLVSTAFANSQNLIGCRYAEIRKYMRENEKDMSLNRVYNNEFKYLKYSNSSDSQTTLFFLDQDSICQSVRIILEHDIKAQKIKELDTIYSKKGANKWIDSKNGKFYNVELRDDDWSSVITIIPGK